MKKVFSLIGITIFLIFGAQINIHAGTTLQESDLEQIRTRQITISERFYGEITPPTTLVYNRGGWVGVLYREYYVFDGTYTLAQYKGTVSCSGQCAMNEKIVSND